MSRTYRILTLIGLADSGSLPVKLMPDGSSSINYIGNLMLFAYLNDPAFLVQRVCVDAATENQKPLPDADIIFNAICDVDSLSGALARVQQLLSKCDKPIINHPERVARTSRDHISRSIKANDAVIIPRTERIAPRSLVELREAVDDFGMAFPLIMRPTGVHNDNVKLLIESAEELGQAECFAFDGSDYYLIEYVDYRSDDGLFRKCRFVVIDGQPHARHLLASRNWNAHTKARYELMKEDATLRDAELRFLESPATVISQPAMEFINGLHDQLGLEFFGMDCGLMADGRLVVFEINNCFNIFHLSHHEIDEFDYLKPCVERIATASRELVRKLSR